jgi:RNA polymerase sigma-70 factor, ECF subfamily
MVMAFQADYVRRLTAGDAQAERELVAHFGPLLRLKVRMRSGATARAHLIEDVVQETFARVFTALRERRIDEPERVGAFVNRVCENVLHELQRSRARFAPLDSAAPEPRSENDPEASAASRECGAVASAVLVELGSRDREIFRAVLVEEEDKDSVCRRFHVTRDHLRVLVHRAKERFRALMEQRKGAGKGSL